MRLLVLFMLCFCSCEGGIFSSFLSEAEPEKVCAQILAAADVQIGGEREWDVQVRDPGFYDRILKDGSLGFGEAYMAGLWDSPKVDQCLFQIIRSRLEENLKPTWAMRWAVLKAKLFNTQDKAGSMKVIEQHYQLGNDLFERMLDGLMTYSCGYWRQADNLEDAQKAKYDLIAKKLEFKKGMKVLDIGCGWGGFAKHISQNYGVEVVGITLSENQAEYARKFCEGLPVQILVQDYREVQGVFDRIVEIGMFEHVGLKNYRSFLEIVHSHLKDDGVFMLHTIGRNRSKFTVDPWIEQYIFSNGHLPSVAQIGSAVEGLFVMEAVSYTHLTLPTNREV